MVIVFIQNRGVIGYQESRDPIRPLFSLMVTSF